MKTRNLEKPIIFENPGSRFSDPRHSRTMGPKAQQIAQLVARGFGRQNDPEMDADTKRHVDSADSVMTAEIDGKIVGVAMFGTSAHDKRVLELQGVVVDPDVQGHDIATELVRARLGRTSMFGFKSEVRLVTAHTRNPAILRLLGKIAGSEGNVYPTGDAPELRKLALGIPDTSLGEDGIAYHVDRYPEGGLYGGEDPGVALAGTFAGLANPRTALVVVADVRRQKVQP